MNSSIKIVIYSTLLGVVLLLLAVMLTAKANAAQTTLQSDVVGCKIKFIMVQMTKLAAANESAAGGVHAAAGGTDGERK